MTRVLLVSQEQVGARMAGPGIRYFHFATELARRGFDVSLVVPNDPTELEGPFEVAERGRLGRNGLRRLASRADVVVAQHLGLSEMRRLAGQDTRTIYDLYVPFLTENLPLHAGQRARQSRADVYWTTNLVQLSALATGDAFICASERQRDLWLGALGALGRIDLEAYEADPTLRSLIDVVPFGLDAVPPRQNHRALKGVVPAIGEEDMVLLWAGGIWNWFDPLTVIRAVATIAEVRNDVKLFFLGAGGPGGTLEEMRMADEARALSDSLALTGRAVFFNRDWVPYEERSNYLLEADIGVSAHFDTVETRFAFRTRLLDHFWAGLPSIVTAGDALAELVQRQDLGEVVGAGDVDAWVVAIRKLVEDAGARQRASANCAVVRERLAWPRVVDRLTALVEQQTRGRRALRTADRLAFAYAGRGARIALKNPGLAAEWWRRRRGS
jgi:glycosyltransferase involved in cell wall biosynthesis